MSNPQGKSPGIDQDGDVGLFPAGQFGRLRDPGHHLAVRHQPFEQAQDGQLADVEGTDHPLLRHSRPTNTHKTNIGLAERSLELARQPGAEGVAGGLCGD